MIIERILKLKKYHRARVIVRGTGLPGTIICADSKSLQNLRTQDMNTISGIETIYTLTRSIHNVTTSIPRAPSPQEPGLNQSDIDDTTHDRENLIKANQRIFQLQAELNNVKNIITAKQCVIDTQAHSLQLIQQELNRVQNLLKNTTI